MVMFGGKPAFGTSAFGSTQPLFGAQQQQSTTLFGTPRPAGVTFGQPVASTAGGPLFGGTNTTTNTGGLFGSSATSTNTSIFGSSSTAAGGLYGSSQTGTSLFGTQQPIGGGGLFGTTTGTTTGLFGTSMAQQSVGTVIKYNPVPGSDLVLKNGSHQQVATKHQCIIAMKEYETKSLEELRCEDYLQNRKGPQPGQPLAFGSQPNQQTSTLGLFGSTAAPSTSTSLFGSSTAPGTSLFGNTSTLGTGTNLFGSQSKPLFGAPTVTTTQSNFTFGQPSTSTATGGGIFGTGTTGGGLFGTTGPAQPAVQTTNMFAPSSTTVATGTTSIFGAPSTSQAATSGFSFGKPATTGLFGQNAQPAFGGTATQQPTSGFSFGGTATTAGGGLFGAKTTAAPATTNLFSGSNLFGSTAGQQQPSTNTGLFGSTVTSTIPFSFGNTQTQAGSTLLGQNATQVKPFSGVGTNTTNFFGQPSVFGQTQPQTSTSTIGQFSFGQQPASTGFGTSTGLFGAQPQQVKPSLGGFSFGATAAAAPSGTGTNLFSTPTQQPAAPLTMTSASSAAQQMLIESQLKSLAQSPYGDSKLLRLLKSGAGTPTVSSPESLRSDAALTTLSALISPPTIINVKPLPPDRPSPRVLTMAVNLNTSQSKDRKLILSGLENDTLTFTEGYVPKRNIKKLILGKSGVDKNSSLTESPMIHREHRRSFLNDDSRALTFMENSARSPNADLDSIGSVSARPSDAFSSIAAPRRSLSPTILSGNSVRLYPELPSQATDEISRDGHLAEADSLSPRNAIQRSIGPSSAAGETEKRTSGIMYERSSSSNDVDAFTESLNGLKCQRMDYYTIPDAQQLNAVTGSDGHCAVPNGFTVGRRDYGSVYWPGSVNITGLNIDELVHFRHKEITVYPDESKKPPVGQGLNRKAEITLERIWPNDKTTHLPIKDIKRLETMKFRERLEKAAAQMDAEFVDYRPETGSWVFKVNHFSKYGLIDDDDNNDPPTCNSVMMTDTICMAQRLPVVKHKLNSTLPIESETYGLGGQSMLIDQFVSEDVEFSDTEPSFLVQPDYINSFLGDQEAPVSKLKKHLFYEHKTEPKILATRSNDFSIIKPPEPYFLEKKFKKHCFVNDLYERSLSLLETKSLDRSRQADLSLNEETDLDDKTRALLPVHSAKASSKPGHQLVQPKNRLVSIPYRKSILRHFVNAEFDNVFINNGRSRVGWTTDNRFLAPTSANETERKTGTILDDEATSTFCLNYKYVEIHDDMRDALFEKLLEVQQLSSVRYNRAGCPHFIPMDGPTTISRYCQILTSSTTQNDHQDADYDDEDLYATDTAFALAAFKLCSVLWGKIDDTPQSHYVDDMCRKQLLGQWMSAACDPIVHKEIEQLEKLGKLRCIDVAFSLVSVGRLVEAADVACKNGDFRLALSISQLGGPEDVKTLYRQQLSQWFQSQADRFIDPNRLKFYVLLAGCTDWTVSNGNLINPFIDLNWFRCFNLQLRYCCPSVATIADCIKLYDSTWRENADTGIAQGPSPCYYDSKDFVTARSSIRPFVDRARKKDVFYHLIKLFSERSYSLATVLNNECWTSDPMSQYLSWHLWCVLHACNYRNPVVAAMLHVQYADQLERCGLWPWAIFVCMHLDDDRQREIAVKQLLSKYCYDADKTQLQFLRNELCLPENWIHEAKALKDRRNNDKFSETWHCITSENFNIAHALFLEHVGPSTVVDDDLERLRSFLVELSAHSKLIENWETGGQIFLDFANLRSRRDEFKAANNAIFDVETLKPGVLSLAKRLGSLKTTTPLQRLCQSEMAFLVAEMLRILLTDDQYLEQYQIIGNLPMPDDYVMEELQRLVELGIKKIDNKHGFDLAIN